MRTHCSIEGCGEPASFIVNVSASTVCIDDQPYCGDHARLLLPVERARIDPLAPRCLCRDGRHLRGGMR